MTSRITKIDDKYGALALLRVEGTLRVAEAEVLEDAFHELRQKHNGLIGIDLSNTSFLDIYSAQEQVTRAEHALKTLMLPNRKADLWSRALLPITPVTLEAPRVLLSEAINTALENRMELARLRTSAEINQIDQKFYRDQTKPQVDLGLSYSSNGYAGTVTDNTNRLTNDLTALTEPDCRAVFNRRFTASANEHFEPDGSSKHAGWLRTVAREHVGPGQSNGSSWRKDFVAFEKQNCEGTAGIFIG